MCYIVCFGHIIKLCNTLSIVGRLRLQSLCNISHDTRLVMKSEILFDYVVCVCVYERVFSLEIVVSGVVVCRVSTRRRCFNNKNSLTLQLQQTERI